MKIIIHFAPHVLDGDVRSRINAEILTRDELKSAKYSFLKNEHTWTLTYQSNDSAGDIARAFERNFLRIGQEITMMNFS